MTTRTLAMMAVVLACLVATTACSHRAPARPLVVASAEFLGEITSPAQQRAAVRFHDGGVPVSVPGGTLWAFGDTFMAAGGSAGTPNFHTATIAFLPTGERAFPPPLAYALSDAGHATSPFPFRAPETDRTHGIWPGGGLHHDGRVWLFYGVVERTPGVGLGFRGAGNGLAVADTWKGPYARVEHGNDDWQWPINPADVVTHDGWAYLFEPIGPAQPAGMTVARVRADELADPARYEYWIGPGEQFVVDRSKAMPAARDVWGQVSIEWNAWLGAWLMVTSSNFYDATNIQLRTAPDPWGPWSEPVRVAVPERPDHATRIVYCTYQHPELAPPGGREVVLTFCRMLEGKWALSNPEVVRLRLGS